MTAHRGSGRGVANARALVVAAVVAWFVASSALAHAGLADLGKLTAAEPRSAVLFGATLAASGDLIVVGAQQDRERGQRAGAVHVYQPDGAGGLGVRKLTASDAHENDHFGASVATSGGKFVVGALYADGAEGSAYVYEPDGEGGFNEVRLKASDAAPNSQFGQAVGISGDTVVVGAPAADTVYVFTPDGAGGYLETQLTAPDVANDFGKAVAVEGDTVVVGASDAAFVYEPDGLGGYDATELTASDAASLGYAYYGDAIAMSGGVIVVGAKGACCEPSGAAYVYAPDGAGGYVETKLKSTVVSSSFSAFGASVAVEDGTVVVGAPLAGPTDQYLGSVHVFRPDGLGGYDATLLAAPDAYYNDEFGTAVAVVDGRVLVGTPNDDEDRVNSGSVYRFGPTAPVAPTIVRNATAGSGSATVSWTAPTSDGGSPITGYVVTPYVGFSPRPSTTFNSTATTQTITGLVNGTQYRFRVQAINAVGTSGYSTVTNPVIPAAPTVVPGPTSIRFEGDAGTKVLNVKVGLSGPSTQTVTVDWVTLYSSDWPFASAEPGVDYVAAGGTVTFTPGQTTQTVPITINGDTDYEPNEAVSVRFSNPTNATLTGGLLGSVGWGNIANDD